MTWKNIFQHSLVENFKICLSQNGPHHNDLRFFHHLFIVRLFFFFFNNKHEKARYVWLIFRTEQTPLMSRNLSSTLQVN